MTVSEVITQVRTTNLSESIDFYVSTLGFELDFQFQDFYAGIKVADGQVFHLKLVDDKDPSIDFVRAGDHLHLFFVTDEVDALAERLKNSGVGFHQEIADTEWGSRTFCVYDNQGHVLCFAQGGEESH